MPDGRYFTRAGVIQPGWVLRIPQPTRTVGSVDEQATYVVAPGDSLSGIAARRLGRMDRWPELFELNRGARLADGRTLTDPNLIWPGLRLRAAGRRRRGRRRGLAGTAVGRGDSTGAGGGGGRVAARAGGRPRSAGHDRSGDRDGRGPGVRR